MSRSRFPCPACGSANIRRSHGKAALDTARALLGTYTMRCQDCHTTFRANVLLLSKLFLARCPRCLSFALTSWDPKNYHIPLWRKLLIQLGAHRYRCNICRCNFVSFRGWRPVPGSSRGSHPPR